MTELTATVVIESLLRATADDATPIIRRLARNQARVFLDSRAGGAGEGKEAFARKQADHWLEDMSTTSLDAKHASLMAMARNCITFGMKSATPAPAVDAVPAGEVDLRQALDDAINSPKGVVPVSAEPFYDGRAGRVKPSEAASTAYLMTGRWELDTEGKAPGIYMDDPEGGDPICLCAIKRVYHPDLLSAALSHGEGRK